MTLEVFIANVGKEKVGREKVSGGTGGYGLGERNDWGD